MFSQRSMASGRLFRATTSHKSFFSECLPKEMKYVNKSVLNTLPLSNSIRSASSQSASSTESPLPNNLAPKQKNSPALTKLIPGIALSVGLAALSTKISKDLGKLIDTAPQEVSTLSATSNESFFETLSQSTSLISSANFDAVCQALLTLPSNSPVPAVPIAIMLGILLRNTIFKANIKEKSSENTKTLWDLSKLQSGVSFASAHFLRAGVVLIGLKLSMNEVLTAGPVSIVGALTGIAVAMKTVSWLNKKLKVPEITASLISAGTAICGVTAIMACSPAIKATERDISIAVANVLLYGLIGMNLFPYVAHYALTLPLGLTDGSAGTFLGLSVHDTSQVIGAGAVYATAFANHPAAAAVLPVAALTKLTRNVMLAGVVPYLAVKHANINTPTGEDKVQNKSKNSLSTLAKNAYKYTPGFVWFFLLVIILRSLGDSSIESSKTEEEEGKAFGFLTQDVWKKLIKVVSEPIATTVLLTSAMAALGLSTNLSQLKGVGIKPFILGGAAASALAISGFSIALLSIQLKKQQHHTTKAE